MKIFRTALLAMVALAFVACKDDDTSTSDKVVQDDENTIATINNSYVYTLPVIFHVLYQNAADTTQYIRYSRFKELLSHVNELYEGGVYGTSSNIGVNFVLATNDESGNKLSQPGVEYVKYSGSYPINQNTLMSDNNRTYTKYIWDPNDYINILVFPFAGTDGNQSLTLGISHMPYAVKSDSALAGLETVDRTHLTKSNLAYAYCVSLNSSYIYMESTRYTTDKGKRSYRYTNADANVTLAHELGHYLGLHHAFTERNENSNYIMVDSCGDTDFCEDTPTYNRYEYNDQLKAYVSQAQSDASFDTNNYFKRYDCSTGAFYSKNLMDYDMSYSFQLSADQRKRIRTVLYYSPLMPGPKRGLNGKAETRTGIGIEGVLNLPIQIAY
jgi:zinc-dependent metalloproteinase lipoprotein